MDIFLVNEDCEHANSLMKKLVNVKDGGIIPLKDGEMELYLSPDFQHIHLGAETGESMFAKLDPGSRYVAMVDPSKVNFMDVESISRRLGIEVAVVRVKP